MVKIIMKKNNTENMFGTTIVNIRRLFQIIALILFFFLVSFTTIFRSHTFIITDYLTFLSILCISIFLLKAVIQRFITKKRDKFLYPQEISFIVLLGILLLLSLILPSLSETVPEKIKSLGMRVESNLPNYENEQANPLVRFYLPTIMQYLYFALPIIGIALIGLSFKLTNIKKSVIAIGILFIVLFIISLPFLSINNSDVVIAIPHNLFLKLSPLIGIMSSVAARVLTVSLLFILPFIVVSLLFGRIFCGWICPFGTIHHGISYLKTRFVKKSKKYAYSKFQKLKYVILLIIFFSAVFSLNIAGFFDPISITTKATATTIIPSTQYVLNTATESWLTNDLPASETVSDARKYLTEIFFYENVTGKVVPTHFDYFLLGGVLFLLLVGLNFVSHRFYCRFICPLGAMFGLISKFSLLKIRINDNCTKCKLCENFCAGGCEIHNQEKPKDSECLMCMNCLKTCPENAIEVSFAFGNIFKNVNKQEPDLSKRDMLTGLAGAIGGVVLMKATFDPKRVNSKLIRPPGAVNEALFLEKCVKCGKCMKACPTNFLHPTFLEAGVDGIFTPIGIGRKGYCELECNACGEICPTQAIKKISLEEKKKLKIGLAQINRSRCLPWAYNQSCIVCEEHCPVSPKAIWLEKVTVKTRNGKTAVLLRPHVDPHKCIGCSICENVCPMVDKPAIQVSSINESRSNSNKLSLQEPKTITENQEGGQDISTESESYDPYGDENDSDGVNPLLLKDDF